jgi:hypothetical protein
VGCGALAQHYAGISAIPLKAVIGSVGRAGELRPNFTSRVRSRVERARVQSLGAALEEGLPLPAIEVYRLGDRYYVLDGHHRVAAARAMGQVSIDAVVTEMVPTDAGCMARKAA